MATPSTSDPARRLTVASIAVSVVLLVVLGLAWLASDSVLALALAADSVADTFAAVVLLIALRVSAKAPDDDHPFGHHGAEPIAALIVAVLTGVLAMEVLRAAVGGLMGADTPRLGAVVAAAFAAKLLAKAVIARAARRLHRTRASPVAHAIAVDARNDAAVSALALVGFFSARYGHPSVDAWLAIPVGIWIGVSGVQLAVENVRLLMGEAPAAPIQVQLRGAISSVSHVASIAEFRARHHGTSIAVRTTITVEGTMSVREAQAIAEAVERSLLAREDVSEAAVSIAAKPVPGPLPDIANLG